jgi:ATP-dependent DNA ligase
MNKTFKTLYKLTGKGDVQEWTIVVEGNKLYTRFGRHGGKIQESAPDIITEGKNVGRKNATTPEQQAMAEAQSEWEKKLKKGYVESIDAANVGAVSDLVQGGVWPMLAKVYGKHGAKIKWPAAVQPKLDGHRLIAVVDEQGKCTLWSRTRKQIHSLPHIVKAIEDTGVTDAVFDGEAYNNAYKSKFQELSHLIRQSEPIQECDIVQYHIYDTVSANFFIDRSAWLKAWYEDVSLGTPLRLVETKNVADHDELMAAFEHYRRQGYEGCMVRNWSGVYAEHPTHRSDDLQKVKQFDDAEWKVIGVNEGRGKLQGHGIFVCVTESGKTFEAKMIGSLTNLKTYYENPESVIGKLLTVQYQGLTDDGLPRFPVAVRFREDV